MDSTDMGCVIDNCPHHQKLAEEQPHSSSTERSTANGHILETIIASYSEDTQATHPIPSERRVTVLSSKRSIISSNGPSESHAPSDGRLTQISDVRKNENLLAMYKDGRFDKLLTIKLNESKKLKGPASAPA